VDELVEAARGASKKMERVPVTKLRFGFRPASEEREAQNVQNVSSVWGGGGGGHGDGLWLGEAEGGGGKGGGGGGCALLRVYPAKCMLKGGFKGKHVIRVAVVGGDDEELDQDTASSFITEPRLVGVPGCDKVMSPEVGGEGDANFWQEVRTPTLLKQPPSRAL
jgi:hypothetical protein